MNIFLSLFQLITIITICVYEYKKKYMSVFLWGTLLVMFGLPHFLSVVFKITLYNEVTMIKASIFVILFNLIYLSTKMYINLIIEGLSRKNKRNATLDTLPEPDGQKIEDEYIVKFFFVGLLCSVFVLTIFGVKNLGSIINFSWGNFRRVTSELELLHPVRYISFFLLALGGVALVYKRLGKKFMFLTSLGIIVFYVMATGNRITVLPALMTMIIPYILDEKNRISFKQVVTLGVMGFFSVYLVYFLRLLRIYGGFYNLIHEIDFAKTNEIIWEMILSGDGELGLRNAFYYFIYYDNNFANFNKGHTYIRLLLIAIPRSLIPEIKPPEFGVSMGNAWNPNPKTFFYSMHPTLYGDCFANLWWFGVFLGIYWAILTYLLEKHIDRENDVVRDMLRVLFGAVYVIVGRGSVYNGLFFGFLGSIIIGLIYLIANCFYGRSLRR